MLETADSEGIESEDKIKNRAKRNRIPAADLIILAAATDQDQERISGSEDGIRNQGMGNGRGIPPLEDD